MQQGSFGREIVGLRDSRGRNFSVSATVFWTVLWRSSQSAFSHFLASFSIRQAERSICTKCTKEVQAITLASLALEQKARPTL